MELLSTRSNLDTSLIIHFLDVGYGDAILIQLPEGNAIMIDGGKPTDAPFIVEKLRQFGIASLRRLVITHFHKDHAGGLLPVLKDFLFNSNDSDLEGKILVPFFPSSLEVRPAVSEVIEALKKYSIEIVRRGKTIPLSPTVQFEVLHPEKRIGDQNEDSLVLKITHGKMSFLMAADAGLLAQKNLVEYYKEYLGSDLIKIPHHANESEVYEPFVNAVKPKVAILTIGQNPYNAPNPEVLMKYQKKSDYLFRTDRHGMISVRSNGETLQVTTERR